MGNISVILSTYNRQKLLHRALLSVFEQHLKPCQIIVVDDGSTDLTAAMLKADFPTVEYYYQPNQGVSSARNFGIKQAEGDWLAFLDSDDQWLPSKLQKQMQALQQHEDTPLCHTEEIWIRGGIRVNAMKKHQKKGGWIFQHCLPLCLISPSSVVIRRTLFNELGFFDESLPACEDYDLWLRITARYPVLFIEDPLIIKYGGHEDQLSKKYWGMDRFRIQALKKIIDDPVLNQHDQVAAIKMLIKKLTIYQKGSIKRGKQQEVDEIEQQLIYYQLQ